MTHARPTSGSRCGAYSGNGFLYRGIQTNYDSLLAQAGDKPIALGEVGPIPTIEKLGEQPRWVWFMSWGEPGGRRGDFILFLETLGSEQVLTLDELPWVSIKQPKIHYPILK